MPSPHYKFRVHRLSVLSHGKLSEFQESKSAPSRLELKEIDNALLDRHAANEASFVPNEDRSVVGQDREVTESALELNKPIHFILTLLTFGVWGIVWWWLILKSEGKTEHFFRGFDDAYWSYLIEREQPPAALHKMEIDKQIKRGSFDA